MLCRECSTCLVTRLFAQNTAVGGRLLFITSCTAIRVPSTSSGTSSTHGLHPAADIAASYPLMRLRIV